MLTEIGGDATHLATDGPAPRRYDGRTTAARVRAAVFVRSEKSNALVGGGFPGFRRARRTSTAPSVGMQLFAPEAWRAAPLLLTHSAQMAQPRVAARGHSPLAAATAVTASQEGGGRRKRKTGLAHRRTCERENVTSGSAVYGAIKKKNVGYKEKRRAIRDSLSTALDAPLATLESDGAGCGSGRDRCARAPRPSSGSSTWSRASARSPTAHTHAHRPPSPGHS